METLRADKSTRKSFATLVGPYKKTLGTEQPWARALSLNARYQNVDCVGSEIKFGRKAECHVRIQDNLSISGFCVFG